MDLSNLVTLMVALLALAATVLTNRQSAKIAKGSDAVALASAKETSRTDLETEAYVRARALDTETIERQSKELVEMRREVVEIRDKYEELESKYDLLLVENKRLKRRVSDLEQHELDHHPHSEE